MMEKRFHKPIDLCKYLMKMRKTVEDTWMCCQKQSVMIQDELHTQCNYSFSKAGSCSSN